MHSDKTYFTGIDGLRALAILSVFIFHIQTQWLPGGFAGVDLFFVISGFVVSFSLFRDSESGAFFPFLARFYKRRLIRIYPALLVCLVTSVASLILFVPDSWLGRANKIAAVSAFFGVSNFALHQSSDGYFTEGAEFNPFGHTWSLAVEEQFYFIFPVLFFVWRRFNSKNNRRFGLVDSLIPALMCASLLFCAWHTTYDKSGAFYLLPSRFWELGLGYLAFRVLHCVESVPDRIRFGSQYLGLLLLLLGFFLCGSLSFPFPGALIPSISGFLLVLGVTLASPSKSWIDRLLEASFMSLLGKMSYSLYLWHWPVFVIFRWTVGFNEWWQYGLAGIISFTLAYLSWRLVETPFQKSRQIRKMAHRKFIVITCGLITLIAALSAIALKLHSRFTLSLTGNKELWYAEFKTDQNSRVKSLSAPFSDFLFKKIIPEGGGSTPERIFLVGDSHSSAYWQNFGNYGLENNLEITLLAKGGCSIGALTRPMEQMKNECKEYYSFVKAYLRDSLRPRDVVFIGSSKARLFRSGEIDFGTPDSIAYSKQANQKRMAAIAEFAELLEMLGKKQVIVSTNAIEPVFPSPAFRCSDWFNRNNPVCEAGLQVPRDYLLFRSKLEQEALTELDRTYEFFSVWNPLPVLCPDSVCFAVKDGMPLFFDADHLSGYGNTVLYPSLSKHLDSLRAAARK